MRQMFLAVVILAASACSSISNVPLLGSSAGTTGGARAPLPADASMRERVSRAVVLLGDGAADEARGELKLALAIAPKDVTALRLLQQIDEDPLKLLGPVNQEYVVAAGDTMSTLAERYLGDALLFYALSRYNGLASPDAIAVGKVLRMPARVGAPPLPVTPTAAAAAVASPPDAVKANGIRLRALESLNRGDAAQAIVLLKQAEAINGADPAIQRDLRRALRIQSALVDN